MARLLVFGESGQLANALKACLSGQADTANFLGRAHCNLTQPAPSLRSYLRALPDYDAVIIAAADTNVDGAEDNFERAWTVNAQAPGVIASWCAARNIPLVHISTDYVFSGSQTPPPRPWRPDDKPDPINAYGQTKLDGEQAITRSGARASILRTSWVYDGKGKNFFTTMMRAAIQNPELRIVDDQIGRPTFAGHLAEAALIAARRLISQNTEGGIYHVSNNGEPVSWAGFASEIFSRTAAMRARPVTVIPIPSSEYPQAARRPAYSVLDISSFEQDHGYIMPPWKDGLDLAIAQWTQTQVSSTQP